MKKFLEENIKFDTDVFTSGFYATLLLIGGEIGLFINGNLEDKRVIISLIAGIILMIGSIIALIIMYASIKNDIKKLR